MKTMILAACCMLAALPADAQQLKSPDGKLEIHFRLDQGGRPTYRLLREGKTVVADSHLGLQLKEENH